MHKDDIAPFSVAKELWTKPFEPAVQNTMRCFLFLGIIFQEWFLHTNVFTVVSKS